MRKWCLHASSLFLIESSSKLLITRTGIKPWMSSILGLWFPWPIYMFFEIRFDLGTLDSGERSLPFELLVLQSFQWILFIMIEPSLNILRSTVPIPVHDLKIKVTDFDFFFVFVKSLQCQLLQSLWLIWIVFGMNGYKILKCFRKEQRVSGELPCLATGLICLIFVC